MSAESVSGSIEVESIKVLMETSRDEYNNENERIAGYNARTNIVLPTVVAYFLAILAMNNCTEILSIEINNVWQAVLPMSSLILYVVSVLFALMAICMMLITLLPKQYIAVNAEEFCDPVLLGNQKLFLLRLSEKYINATKRNRDQNNKRMKTYKRACILVVISIISFMLYNFIKQ